MVVDRKNKLSPNRLQCLEALNHQYLQSGTVYIRLKRRFQSVNVLEHQAAHLVFEIRKIFNIFDRSPH